MSGYELAGAWGELVDRCKQGDCSDSTLLLLADIARETRPYWSGYTLVDYDDMLLSEYDRRQKEEGEI